MPSYTFSLDVKTDIAEAQLRSFRDMAKKQLSDISVGGAGGAGGAGGGGGSGRAGGSLLAIDKTIERQRTAIAKAETDQRIQIAKDGVGQIALSQQQLLGIDKEKSRQSVLLAKQEFDEKQQLALQEVHSRVNASNMIIAATKNQAAQEIASVQNVFGERARALREDTSAQMEVLRSEMADALDAKPRSQEQINSIDLAMTEAKEEERRLTAVAQAEAKERIAAITNEANARISQSERSKQAAIADEKAITAAKKPQGGHPLQGALKTGFLAYGAYLATKQAVEASVDFGRTGAQQLRTQQTIEQLGDRIGVDSDKMAQAVKKATNSSVSDMEAMGFSANILAQRFAGEVDDISGDTAVLAKASRRLAQVYADENGDLLTTEQVFSRLVKFAREGNKELVDQFGISNQLIAETLGISTDGLRGAEGAVNRWKGMVQILNEELARLGEPVDSTADRMEQAFARMTTAIDKLRQASAEPITITIEWLSNQTEDFATGLEGINAIKESQALYEKGQTVSTPALDMLGDSMDVLDKALVTGKMGLAEYTANVIFVVDAYHKMEDAARRTAAEMERLRVNSARLVAEDFASQGVSPQGQAEYRMGQLVAGNIAPADMTEAERDYRMAVGNGAERVRILQAAVDAAAIGTDEYLEALAELNGATLSLADEMGAIKGEIRGIVGDIKKFELDMQMVGASPAEKLAIMQQSGGYGIKPGSPEDRAYQLELANLEQDVIEENARLGEAAQREWMQTAKEVERMFEAAADKIMSIPGVTSLTAVTEGEMLDAKYGVYREQPDEWLRRGRDELLNKVDRPNVSREQMEKLAGLPAGLPPELLIGRVEEKWQSGSLFADPANLELMNMDAIKGRYEEMKAGETGRANQKNFIMEQLGISAQDAALITGQQAPIVQMLTGGQSDEEISSQLGGTLSSVMKLASGNMDMKDMAKKIGGGITGAFDPGSKDYIDVAGPVVKAWSGQFMAEEAIKGIKGIGKFMSENIFVGFNNNIVNQPWAQGMIQVIMDALRKEFEAMKNAA